jgi:hypothetical protein
MAILSNDLQLVASAVMNDSEDGGGSRTDSIIVDGQSNNIFEDISTLDRVYGNVSLRKVFCDVRTQDDDKLLGAHAIISKLPGDSQIGVNLFSTDDHHDKRPNAASRIENYKGQAGKYLGFLYGTQYKGSRTLTIYQNESAPVPSIGDVLLLLNVAQQQTQYVRIVDLNDSVQNFTDSNGVFTRRVVSIELSTTLQYDFIGAEMSRLDTQTPNAVVYNTMVANAAKYYSSRKLDSPAAIGDLSVNVDTVYSQVVPSSQTQIPLVDLNAAGDAVPLIASAANTISFSSGFSLGAGVSLYLGRPCLPGTLSIAYGGGTVTDNGGQLKINGTTVGTIDYQTGLATFSATAPSLGSATITYKPAGAPLTVADTDSISVTDNNRSYVYTLNINPPPEPNALRIAYMALGNWYTLADNGTGGLIGQSEGVGSGSINYVTGSCALSLAALPDVGSEIIFSWGKKVDYTDRSGGNLAVSIYKQLSHTAINPTSLVISWNDGTPRSLTCNAAGVLSGYGSGSLNSATGEVEFIPTTLPAKDTVISYSYNYGSGSDGVVSKTLTAFNMTGDTVELNLGDTNILAGSLAVFWAVAWGSSIPDTVLPGDYAQLPNPPSGTVQQADRDNNAGSFIGGRSASVNYSTGIVTFDWTIEKWLSFPLFSTNVSNAGVSSIFRGYLGDLADLATPTQFIVNYRLSNSASNNATDTLTLSSLSVGISTGSDTLVDSSLRFSLGDKTYIDRLGQLYYGVSPQTGTGTFGGTVDYASHSVVLNTWTAGATNSGTVSAALGTQNLNPVDKVALRTISAPLKPALFSIRATQYDGGALVTATVDENGDCETANIVGHINQETGVGHFQFGQWVTAAGNESEPWYNAANVVNGQIFHPKPVLAETILYNAVSYSYIPLESDILGLDPVRLPVDGRIPVYQKGDVVVILNDQTTVGTFTSSTTTDLGRVRLAKVRVKDLGNNYLDVTKWSVDLDTGIITWGDLAGISQPLTIIDRIEDMAVVTDVQINGKLSLSTPVTHNYPANTTLVASAVIFGDVYARASTPFDQQTWTNVWQDTPIGNTVSAQYDAVNYPIEVENLSTIEERWAIIFVTSSTFNVVGEHVGQIASGQSISVDLAPINPNTNDPYFLLRYQGWGSGWSAGNVLRFNTYQAAAPLWIVQSVGQGDATDTDFGFCLEFRGDTNM